MHRAVHNTHLVEYPFHGAKHALYIEAASGDEARARVVALAQAEYVGRVHGFIECKPNLLARLRNWFRAPAWGRWHRDADAS